MNIKKRIIFSRHGLRYPLFYREKFNEQFGRDLVNWNFSDEIMGTLTEKGEAIEFRFGQELKKLLNLNDDSTARIVTNSTKRTYVTSRVLATAMMPYQDLPIEYRYKDFKTLDSRYNVLFHNDYLINQEKAKRTDEKLMHIYERMEEVLKLKKGRLTKNPTKLYLDKTGYLNVTGALRMATDICDMFILKYYHGFAFDDIFVSDNFFEDLKLMSKAKDEFLDLIFGDLTYINESKENIYLLLKEEASRPEPLTLIVGHDSNLSCIFAKLGIDYKMNNNMIEKYPIGAKLIIDIFEDNSCEIKYVYFHYEDIRNIGFNKPIVESIYKGRL